MLSNLDLNIMGPPSNVYFSASAYFVNGNTQLMSDLTDNQFYSSPEQIWLCIHLNFASLSRPAIDSQKMPILGKKRSSFQMKLILILADIKTSKIVAFGAQNTRTHTLKSRRTQTSHCSVRILVQRHNRAIFLRK